MIPPYIELLVIEVQSRPVSIAISDVSTTSNYSIGTAKGIRVLNGNLLK